jgi:hypothetical protein
MARTLESVGHRRRSGRYAVTTSVFRKLLLVLLLALLPACGGGGGGDVEDEGGTPAAAAPLVVLLRYGGIAGTNDRVTVDNLGVVMVVSDRLPNASTRTLSSGELASLRTALQRAEITTLERNYLDHQARDAYQYDVIHQGVTVTADEAVIPAKLRPVVDELKKLIP